MRVLRAFTGEFGLKVCYHVPAVFALDGPYAMEIEPGDEALYPGASEYRVISPFTGRRPGGHHWAGTGLSPRSPKRRFVPEPHVRQGIRADVVVCPRAMAYGASKNWPHWAALVDEMVGRDVDVFAAGAPGSSVDVRCPVAWAWPRFLDASIEAIRSARLVIATDAGLAHLAVLCGAPLLLITHRGLVAPGPVLDSEGTVMERAYWPVMMERYRDANHTNSPIEVLHYGWTEPESVATAAMTFIEGRRAA